MARSAKSPIGNHFHPASPLEVLRGSLGRWCAAALCALLFAGGVWAQEKAATPAPSKSASRPSPTKPAPAAARSEQKTPAPTPAPSASETDDGQKALEEIFACVQQGLPQGWQRAWVIVKELSSDEGRERSFEARFQVSLERSGDKRWDFVPCNARDVGERVYRLNVYLEPAKRNWKSATLLFMSEGKFELKYDYAP